jgi:phosphatidate cytidylyltransferase
LLKRILTAVILIPVVVYLVLWAPVLAMAAVTCIVALLALQEYLGLAKAAGAGVFYIVPLVATILIFVTVLPSSPTILMLPVLAIAAAVLLVQAMSMRPQTAVLPDAAFSFFSLIYVALPLATLPHIAQQENGRAELLFLLLVVWAGDIAALFIGRAIGKHKLWPSVSPNKTWEGTIGSLAGSLLVAFLTVIIGARIAEHYATASPFPHPLWQMLLLAVVINIAAQLGDLVESALKRGAGVKDSGRLLPGHGGVLDRIDALLLAAPVLWYAQLIQQYFW